MKVKVQRIVADDSAKLAEEVSKTLNDKGQPNAEVQYTSVCRKDNAITHFAFIKFFEEEKTT